MLTLFCVYPVTSAECERSFSAQQRIKTYIRSTMKEDRLNGLALMNIQRDIDLNVKEVIDTFAHLHPRKLSSCMQIKFELWFYCGQGCLNVNYKHELFG